MSSPPNPRVVSLGAVYLDIVCHEFPFEDALKTERQVVGSDYEFLPGGSAVNFACTATSLDLPTTLVGKLGTDLPARTLRTLVGDAGVDLRSVASADVKTNMSINFNGPSGKSLLTTVGTANQSMAPDEVLPIVKDLLPGASYLYLGGCLKLTALLPTLVDLVADAHDIGVKVVVDHGRVLNSLSEENRHLVRELCRDVDFYLPSVDELVGLWDADSVESAVVKVKNACDGTLIVKDGGNGVTAFVDGEVLRAKAYPVAVGNPVGAGDGFNAGFVCAHSNGMSFEDSLDFGCATAAAKISRPEMPTREGVEKMRATR